MCDDVEEDDDDVCTYVQCVWNPPCTLRRENDSLVKECESTRPLSTITSGAIEGDTRKR